jgi:hypothetical protein
LDGGVALYLNGGELIAILTKKRLGGSDDSVVEIEMIESGTFTSLAELHLLVKGLDFELNRLAIKRLLEALQIGAGEALLGLFILRREKRGGRLPTRKATCVPGHASKLVVHREELTGPEVRVGELQARLAEDLVDLNVILLLELLEARLFLLAEVEVMLRMLEKPGLIGESAV